MKVREIISISGWNETRGQWDFINEVISNEIIEIGNSIPEEMDWAWWELNDPIEGKDLSIKVEYYPNPAEWDWYNDGDAPVLATYEIWESAIRAEREML